jgi:hypothetical protein
MGIRPFGLIGSALFVVGSFGVTVQACALQGRDQGATLQLRPADGEIAEGFSVISSIRELGDGRVLISDEKETRLILADFRSGSVTTLGRRGRGPGEYQQVARLWAVAGDSTLHKEPFSARLLMLDGARIAQTVGLADRALAFIASERLLGVDHRGGMIVATRASSGDSLHLVRVLRGGARADTIARLQSQDGWSGSAVRDASTQPVAAGTRPPSARPNYVISLTAPDQVAVFPDGWIAIARANPYRVDWCPPVQRCRVGAVISADQPRMTDREKQAYLEIAARTHGWPPTSDLSETSGWPNVLPPFAARPSRVDAGEVLALPDGSVLIERLPSAAAMWVQYDIVTRDGRVAGRIRLPLGEQIVGFGKQSVYVVAVDSDGLQRLRRHPWEFSAQRSR